MPWKNAILLAAVVLLVSPAAVVIGGDFNFRADRPVRDDDAQDAFGKFEKLLPLVKNSANEKAAATVREALGNRKNVWTVIPAVEAVRQGEVDDPGSGAVFLDDILPLMGEDCDELHEDEFFTVNVLACLGAMAEKGDDDAIRIVKAIVGWQRWSENEVTRLRDVADRVLFKLTAENSTLNNKTLGFWEWWIATGGKARTDEKPPERQSKTAPVVFKEPIVGTRTMFVIDTSDSMRHPINNDDKEKLAREVPHLDWDDIDTPMDLAIAELVHSLRQLEEEKKPDRDERKTGTKEHFAYRHFAIITYDTDVELLTPGWVAASKGGINEWCREVKRLEPEHTTNIHGAIKMSFGLGGGESISARPALDRDCLLHGAHTIVFLTDGYPTWSDDSNDRSARNEWGHSVGDGEYVKRDKLLELTAELNRFRKVIVNTVGIGAHDRELMEGMAEMTGGSYTDWECRIEWK